MLLSLIAINLTCLVLLLFQVHSLKVSTLALAQSQKTMLSGFIELAKLGALISRHLEQIELIEKDNSQLLEEICSLMNNEPAYINLDVSALRKD
jgi:hypothetical protein